MHAHPNTKPVRRIMSFSIALLALAISCGKPPRNGGTEFIPPAKDSAAWVVDMFFKQSKFPNMEDYLIGELAGKGNRPSMGESFGPDDKVACRQLESSPQRQIYAIAISTTNAHFDYYCYLAPDNDKWKMTALRSLAMTGIYKTILYECGLNPPTEDSSIAVCENARLMISSDEELKLYLISNLDKFEKLVRPPASNLSKSGTESDGDIVEELFLARAFDPRSDGSVYMLVGGLVDNELYYVFVPDSAKPPTMSPSDKIYVEQIVPNWYLVKTT